MELKELWPAPRARQPINAIVELPGSKSITNRALILAALSRSPVLLRAPLRSRDTDLMVDALRSMGTDIEQVGADWRVAPAELRGPSSVDCGLAGTVMRFVPPLACLATGPITFDGDEGARRRPMSQLLAALRTLGADIHDDGRGTLPFTVHGSGHLAGGHVRVDSSASSQFISALLLSAARFDKGVVVENAGDRLPGTAHITMTVAMLRDAGVVVDDSVPGIWRVEPGHVQAPDQDIEPDLSNAGPFVAAALVTGGEVTVRGWPARTTQAGDALRNLLAQMGAQVTWDERGLTVRGTGVIHGIDADLGSVGELTPVIAALAALSDSPSTLRGIAHLRGHETNRLAALRTELSTLGSQVHETPDGLVITPQPLRGATFGTYHDHRMAHAGAILGLAVDGVQIENIGTTSKTMPDFPQRWHTMINSPEGY